MKSPELETLFKRLSNVDDTCNYTVITECPSLSNYYKDTDGATRIKHTQPWTFEPGHKILNKYKTVDRGFNLFVDLRQENSTLGPDQEWSLCFQVIFSIWNLWMQNHSSFTGTSEEVVCAKVIKLQNFFDAVNSVL